MVEAIWAAPSKISYETTPTDVDASQDKSTAVFAILAAVKFVGAESVTTVAENTCPELMFP